MITYILIASLLVYMTTVGIGFLRIRRRNQAQKAEQADLVSPEESIQVNSSPWANS